MTVLYIDDDQDDREVFQEAVFSIDPKILCYFANDGEAGMNSLRTMIVMPDLIFVDVNMPVMDGKQFLLEAKRTQGIEGIPIIMYSTTTNEAEIKLYSRLGAFDFIIKPGSFNELRQILIRVFRGERVGILSRNPKN